MLVQLLIVCVRKFIMRSYRQRIEYCAWLCHNTKAKLHAVMLLIRNTVVE